MPHVFCFWWLRGYGHVAVRSSPATYARNQLQYTFYRKSRLEIHSPTGTMLTVIEKPLPSTTDEDAVYQLYCQTLLLEVMFYEVNERVKLPPWAMNSVARVIGRIDGYLKRQISM